MFTTPVVAPGVRSAHDLDMFVYRAPPGSAAYVLVGVSGGPNANEIFSSTSAGSLTPGAQFKVYIHGCNVDPAGGSWYVEALTDRVEREARRLLEEIEQAGGAARAVERGLFQEAIARSAYAQQRSIESGESVVVGVNEYADDQEVPSIPAPDYTALAAAQRSRTAEMRGTRDAGNVKRVLGQLEAAARDPLAPLMEPILDAVRARATVGEISDALRRVWGVYRPV